MLRSLLLALACAATASAQPVTTGIFVGNQGRPASLTVIDPAAGTAQQLPVALSGFLQGMQRINGRLYVTGNGTRIDVVDPATRQRVAQITDAAFATARYIEQVTPAKAYVTTQNYAAGATTSEVVVVDLTTNTVSGRITVPVQPEGLALAGGRVYVSVAAFGGSSSLVVIDPSTDAVSGRVDVGCPARTLLSDDDGELFAVCPGEIVRVDGATGTVSGRTAVAGSLGSSGGIGQDAVVARTQADGEQQLFAISSAGVVVYGTDTHAVTSVVAIPNAATREASAIGVDPQRGQIVLGRPDPTSPFSAAGTVTVHTRAGALVATYPAGVFPSYVSVFSSPFVAADGGPEALGLRLAAPVPNPASGTSWVRFSLADPADVAVSVVDALGRTVARLAQGAYPPGEHRVAADVRGLPAGVYTVRLAAAGAVATERLTVVR